MALSLFLAAESPAYAGFGLTKLRSGSSTGHENYIYTAGDVIVPEGATDSGRYRRLTVRDSSGGIRSASACAPTPAGGGLAQSYSVQVSDPVSTGTAWKYTLEQFSDPLCAGAPDKTASLHFTVAAVTAYANQALTVPATVFAPGGRPYLRIRGIGSVKGSPAVNAATDWDVTWVPPSGGVACANTGGGDRPDSSALGVLPGPAASWLQYPPNPTDTGDAWNRESRYETRPCPALSTTNQGLWKLTLTRDGTHYVTLAAFTVSDAPPAPVITSAAPSPSSDTQPDWSFSGQAASSFECRMETAGGTPIADWAACTSPRTYNLGGRPDGTYRFRVRGVSATGTRGPDASATYDLLAAAPAAPSITATPASPGNDGTPSWTVAGTGGETLECRLTRDGALVADWSACAGVTTYDLSGEPDGTYTFAVRGVSGTGVRGGARTNDYELDRTNPAAPVFDADPGPIGTGRTPEWSFAAEPGATFECRLERGGVAVSDWSPCTSPQSYDLTAEPDGTYDFLVRATDASGNTSSSALSTYVLDSSAPPAPSIVATPASPATGRSPSWSFTGAPGTTLECRLDHGGATVSDWTACSGTASFDLTGAPDGGYTFGVRAVSAALVPGPAASDTYVLDTTTPAAPVISFSPGPVSANRDPLWWFTGEADARFECHLDGPAGLIADWAACASPADFDLTGQPDGNYVLSVRATDQAGNTGPATTDPYTLDTTPPGTPAITFGPGPLSANDDPMWSFTGDPSATFECQVERSGTPVVDWESCGSPASFSLSAEPDGDYTFAVRGVDGIGNTGSAATNTYTLDRTPPGAPSITAAPPSPGRDRTPQWTFDGEAGATFECRVVRGATSVHDWAGCASGGSHDLAGEPDGTYTLQVRAIDGAGNTGGSASSDYDLDTTTPAAPSIDSAPPSPGSDTGPAWSFTGEPGATLECRLTSGATVVSDWGSCSGSRSYDVSGQPDGTFTFAARATDAAGNTGPAAQSDYALDRAVPPAPVINSGPGAIGSGRSPQWGFSGSGATYECRATRSGATVVGWHTCSSPETVDLAGAPDGLYTFAVRAVSAAGVSGPAATDAYTLDTTPPAPPAITAAPVSPGSSRAPSWSFTVEPGAGAQCRLDRGATAVHGWASCTAVGYSLTGEPDGDYRVSVRAVDAAGNTGAATTSDYSLDTQPPAAPTISDAPQSPGSGPTPTWRFTSGDPGDVLECRVSGGDSAGGWAPCTSPYAADLSANLDATYTFAVRATDPAGNTGASAAADYELDRVGAAVHIVEGPGAIGRDRAPTWVFESEAGASFQCALSGSAGPLREWAGCAVRHTESLDGRPDGVYLLDVRASDRVANTGAAERSRYELDTTPPGAPAIVGSPGQEGTEARPVWSFTLEPGAAAECRLEEGAQVVSDWGGCSSPYGAQLQSDGTYRLGVRARDAAGNTGPSGTDAYRLDTTPPDPPDIRSSPGPRGTDRTPAWSFTGERGASFECRLTVDGDTVARRRACESPWRYSLTSEPDGDYTFSVRARDRVGNASDWTADPYELTRDDPRDSTAGGGAPAAGGAPPATSPAAPAPAPAAPAAPATQPGPTAPTAKPAPAQSATPATTASRGDSRPAPAGKDGARAGGHRAGAPAGAGAHRAAPSGDGARGSRNHKPHRGRTAAALRAVGRGFRAVGRNADKSVFPISLIFLVVAFVAVQNRIDRSDPKLALAPLEREPDLTFDQPHVL